MADNIEAKGTQRIKLNYFRNVDTLKVILDEVKKQEAWNLTINKSTDDEIILYGTSEDRRSAYRVIAAIDLPRPGIMMQMWGIQISSNNPQDLAEVMLKVRHEINQTQQLVRETYAQIEQYAKTINEKDFDPEFKQILDDLGYKSALSSNRPLSLLDMVLRMVAAEMPNTHVTKKIANDLTNFIEKDERYRYYLDRLRNEGGQPLERFFSIRGLKPTCRDQKIKNTTLILPQKCWETGFEDDYAQVSRAITLEFGLHYGYFISKPDSFSPYYLQQSADVFNNRLQNTIDALNQDIEDFFVMPTLLKIQEIVSKFKDVEYAQVGRTSLASLSGIKTTVNSNSVSAFDVTPPLKLSDLLTKADGLNDQVGNFVPAPVVGSLPLGRVISLVAAFQEQDAKFRELKTGVSLVVTPNVLQNMNSAELAIDLTIVDPVASGTEDKESQQPLSRIGEQKVTTTVYTKAVDFFALSTFSNQSTLSGGRGYVPIIGTVWRGIFGEVPILGNLFSWKKSPKKVLHESLLLTNSFITPTAMGMGLLYPLESGTFDDDQKFCKLKNDVGEYTKNPLFAEKGVCKDNKRLR
ncbi:type II and III secretion system protein [Nostoc sp. HG1]|nr:type II and III secretion system protein [Nostoc sp. HG1]